MVNKMFADWREARRLKRAFAAEIRAILELIARDRLVELIEAEITAASSRKMTGIEVNFRSNYNYVFIGAAGKLGLLPSRQVERIIAFHYHVQLMIERMEIMSRENESDDIPYAQSVVQIMRETQELGRDLVNELELGNH